MKVLVWFSSVVFAAATLLSSCSFALTDDGLTLLEIKSTLNDSGNYLGNWLPTDETPCNWTGISCFPNLQRVRSINLPYMQLGGEIPPSIGKLNRLQRLALHQNNLHGLIPNEITNCIHLRALYLRANYLEGGIPSNIGSLSLLTVMDLSSNLLKGAIPSSIGRLTRLRYLNLSTNFFSGEIPDIGVLNTFGNKSFLGNLNLCGQQVHKPCRTSLGFPAVLPHAEIQTKRSSRYIKGVLIGAMSTLAVMLVVLLAFLWICLLSKKERDAKKYTEVKKQVHKDTSAKLITFHGDLPYPSCEIIEKLESLDEEDVVGSGGFGTVYRMVMNDCGTFAVKRIDRNREGSDEVFEREVEILGSIKHINLVNLRGYCRLPTSKLLIYDYLAMGSLDDFLHESKEARPLNWCARLKIALGSARDFGLAKLLVDGDAHVTTVVAGTFGYLAPEYLQSGRATEKSDVYSFGVLLLELVTGKRPTDPAFVKRGLNVVGWMNTLLNENRLEDIVDGRCNDDDMETLEAILEVAARCTDANPDERPTMNQVVQLLEQEVNLDFTSACNKKLQGKVAVIAGSASGIGEATVHLFLDRGAGVIVIVDIQDEKDVESLVQSTIQLYGRLDIMFCNSGIMSQSTQMILEFDLSSCDKLFAVSVGGVAGLELGRRFDEGANTQLAPHGIRIRLNCVSPGSVATPALCKALGIGTADIESMFSRMVCLKNGVLKVKHVANAVVFLASEESQFITGHNLNEEGQLAPTGSCWKPQVEGQPLLKLLKRGARGVHGLVGVLAVAVWSGEPAVVAGSCWNVELLADPKANNKKLQDKVAIITGGASGIGEATVHLFVDHSAGAIVIADIQDEKGEELAASIGNRCACTYVHCDVTKEQDVESLVQSTIQLHGRLDIMFCNAGILSQSMQTILEFDLSSYEKLFAVNVGGVAASIKHAGQAMVKANSRGSIICTASRAAGLASDRNTDYVMSKSSVVALMRCASTQLAPHGIRVNCVSPGPVETPALCETLGMGAADTESMFSRMFRLKNDGVLKVKHVADAVVFLASEESQFITGHNLLVDGLFQG
ncbi:putative peptide/nitrate transporter [Hibiscus syriacus]|uniref:Peptide/nitrate transporter n=1 Tax=Hibiscus syriacus TaxID=106335 RepID=A0A6A3CQI0_HIBSY|nr:putative peptide/nitrate transporter [Hibiscus syriacus]